MELNKKVDQLLQELKSGKFNKVILEGKKLLKKYPNKEYLQNICGLAHQRLKLLAHIKPENLYIKLLSIPINIIFKVWKNTLIN